nr:immunoglobulin light chain junction region [Macaca mulatta]
CMQGLGFPLTF